MVSELGFDNASPLFAEKPPKNVEIAIPVYFDGFRPILRPINFDGFDFNNY